MKLPLTIAALVLLSMPAQADPAVGPFRDAVFWNSNLGCLSEAENGECIMAECKKVPCISNNIGAKECGICDPVTIQKGGTGAKEVGRAFPIGTGLPNAVICMLGKPCPDYDKSIKRK